VHNKRTPELDAIHQQTRLHLETSWLHQRDKAELLQLLEIAHTYDVPLHGVNLHACDLSGSSLRYYTLSGASLMAADLRGTDLRDTRLVGTDLYGSLFAGANLTGVDLQPAHNIYAADFRGCDLRETRVHHNEILRADLDADPFTQLPQYIIDDCSRDMLYVLSQAKSAIPTIRQHIQDGTFNSDTATRLDALLTRHFGSKEAVREHIPFYNHFGLTAMWCGQIQTDTLPDANGYASHTLTLMERVENA
jgi:hypothetical protein